MNIRRRRLRGAPLLIASAGAATALVACDKTEVSGNLVAPPMVELCIEVEPAESEAEVTINGWSMGTEVGCVETYEGSNDIAATAEGYEPYAETLEIYEDTNHTITMTPAAAGDSGDTGQ